MEVTFIFLVLIALGMINEMVLFIYNIAIALPLPGGWVILFSIFLFIIFFEFDRLVDYKRDVSRDIVDKHKKEISRKIREEYFKAKRITKC